MSKKKSMEMGLFDLMDHSIALSLGVDVETYIDVIENKCTEEDATKIIMTIFDSEDKPEEIAKAKAILKNSLNHPLSRVIIVTARDDFDDKEKFLATFRKFGFDRTKLSMEKDMCWTDTIFPNEQVPDNECFEYYYKKIKDDNKFDSIDDHSGLSMSAEEWQDVIDSIGDQLTNEEKESLEQMMQKHFETKEIGRAHV